MPGEVHVPLRPIIDKTGRVLRLVVEVYVVPPRQPDYRSKKTAAVIDTGAMRSSVPPHIIDYFDRNFGRANLIETTPSAYTVADGTIGLAPRFLFDFIISVSADPSRGRKAFEVQTRSANRGPILPECFELPLRSPPSDGSVPARPGPDDCVMFGMDLLHRWKLNLDGPGGDFSLTVCHT